MPDKQGRPTKSETKRKLATLCEAEDALRMVIYKLVERTDVPFWTCLKSASPEQRETLAHLQSSQIETEAYAIERGWAYRWRTGGLCWHR